MTSDDRDALHAELVLAGVTDGFARLIAPYGRPDTMFASGRDGTTATFAMYDLAGVTISHYDFTGFYTIAVRNARYARTSIQREAHQQLAAAFEFAATLPPREPEPA